VLAASVAAKLDVVLERLRGGAASSTARVGRSALTVRLQRPMRGMAEAHARAVRAQRVEEPAARSSKGTSARPIAGTSRAPGCPSNVRHRPRRGVGREAEPPVLVGTDEVNETLVATGLARRLPSVRTRPLAHIGRVLQARQEPREGLGLVRFERHAPGPLHGVPTSPGDRTQELAQPSS